ncbi:hypothetical protein [Paraglaciecola sp. L3A3]|uniref:hypothetical protein n=1 Tax=Paraglaciecola sp. L3A3 TaxID=2686358 RepID=UPI00131B950F|nr:hypothetical protein [Paraglaciecola sp. L3A3]
MGEIFIVDIFLDLPVSSDLTGGGFGLTIASGNVFFVSVDYPSLLARRRVSLPR